MLCDILRGLRPPIFMQIKIYTKPGCKYCRQAKILFERANLEWEEINCVGDDAGRLKEDYPDAGGYPWVIIDDEVVGPLTETAKLFLQKGLVNSPKK